LLKTVSICLSRLFQIRVHFADINHPVVGDFVESA
jgi:hypothetical protein